MGLSRPPGRGVGPLCGTCLLSKVMWSPGRKATAALGPGRMALRTKGPWMQADGCGIRPRLSTGQLVWTCSGGGREPRPASPRPQLLTRGLEKALGMFSLF